jgi:DNA-directed RNA polymerase subunit L
MKIKKVVDKKTELRLEIEGEDDTLFNMLREKLVSMPDVDDAGYRKEHPLIDKIDFVLFTKSKAAKTVLNAAITDLAKDLTSLKRGIK